MTTMTAPLRILTAATEPVVTRLETESTTAPSVRVFPTDRGEARREDATQAALFGTHLREAIRILKG